MEKQKVTMTDARQNTYLYNEAVKTLRTNLQFAGRNVKTIMLTSCYPNEGKSDTVLQLAREFGNMGKKVLVLDADIRKSAFISHYQVKKKLKGLSQYLSGQASLTDVLFETNFDNVDFIFAGASTPNPSELLEDPAFGELVKYLRQNYDYILIDTPPLSSVIDAAIVAKQCDGAVLVVENESVSWRAALRAKEQLEKTGCKILGAVLNKVDMDREKYYYKKDRYYDYYYYRK